MRYAVVPHGVAESPDDMVLATDLGEALGTVSPVEGLVVDHSASLRLAACVDRGRLRASGGLARCGTFAGRAATAEPGVIPEKTSGAVVRSSQVTCGTQANPLRAAAFRP